MSKVIKIIIEGGIVQDVHNLPEGWSYEVDDLDEDETEYEGDKK